MSTPLLILAAILIGVIFLFLFRVQALVAVLRGSDKKPGLSNKVNAFMFMIFLVVFSVSYIYYTLEGEYGLPESASVHGLETDHLFIVTTIVISAAMLLTNFLLFFFSYRYQYEEGKKARFFPDHHLLELTWTVVPAIVLAFLVFQGNDLWTEIMSPTKKMVAEKIELEIVGSQFKWEVRFPGLDKQLGAYKFEEYSAVNALGISLADEAGYDDFQVTEMVLPVGKPVHFKIRAKDVIHSVFAPHFRVKMDAVPGLPTEFWFTPRLTTADMRLKLAANPRFQDLDVDGNKKSDVFNYEIACTEVCGRGHNSMRFVVRVVSEEEYEEWFNTQAYKAPFVLLAEEYIMDNLPSNMRSVFAKKLAQFKEGTQVIAEEVDPVNEEKTPRKELTEDMVSQPESDVVKLEEVIMEASASH
jgi:cytochrome c oxidase subunit 2